MGPVEIQVVQEPAEPQGLAVWLEIQAPQGLLAQMDLTVRQELLELLGHLLMRRRWFRSR